MRRSQILQRLITPRLLLAIALTLGKVAWAADHYKVMYSFTGGTDGGGVFAGLAIDAHGSLYGTTRGGGKHGEGTVFKVSRAKNGGWRETVIRSFCPPRQCSDGYLPESTPAFDASGNLFGTTESTSFELSPTQHGWDFTVISDNAAGSSLIIDRTGNLYGAGGSVWELTSGSNGWKVKILHTFCSQHDCRDGWDALAPPTFDPQGNLYGTTEFGGGNNAPECSIGCGVVYQVQNLGAGKWKYHVLHRFAAFPNDGLMPQAGVTLDSKGNVYGTTLYSGPSAGTVFKLSPQQDGHWKETILYDFPNSNKNGGAPVGGVTFDNQGNLYGTASAGGDPVCDCGVVFKMTPHSKRQVELHGAASFPRQRRLRPWLQSDLR